jgi:type II secretory pathway pseudopilin PulG
LGILAAIAIPRLGGFRTTADWRANVATGRTIASAITMYHAEEGEWPADNNFDATTGIGEYLDAGFDTTGWEFTASDAGITVTGPEVNGNTEWYPVPEES